MIDGVTTSRNGCTTHCGLRANVFSSLFKSGFRGWLYIKLTGVYLSKGRTPKTSREKTF